MEPAVIDWNMAKSEEYVRDEVYEHINAPKWLDLSAPPPDVDDAYFCRPDCRHPKSAADNFHTWSPPPKAKPMIRTESDTMLPLGERNNHQRDGNTLKRRGGVATLLHSSSTRGPAKSKGNASKFRDDDLENRNPNVSSGVKVAKEAVKSSALKRGPEEEEEEEVEEEMAESTTNKKPVPKLKSTLSARNLFSGRDIMSQLSEFCNEIKKLAVGKEKPTPAKGGAKEEERKVLLESSPKKNEGSVKRSSRLTVKVLSENSSVLREVRACPPTPQRFPSPSSRRLRSTKAAAAAGTSSPLHKPSRSTALESGIFQELDRRSEEKRAMVAKDHGNCTSTAVASDAEGRSSSIDMFWFLKPCTYLV